MQLGWISVYFEDDAAHVRPSKCIQPLVESTLVHHEKLSFASLSEAVVVLGRPLRAPLGESGFQVAETNILVNGKRLLDLE